MKQIKKTKKVVKKHESGRSMIEMVGVLAVMGLITAGAFVLITSALRSQRMVRIDDDISAIAGGIRLLYANQPNFDALTGTNAATATAGAMQLIGYDTVTTPYGGKYTLSATAATTTAPAGTFTVTFTTDSTTACGAIKDRLNGSNGGTATCSDKSVAVTFTKYAQDSLNTKQKLLTFLN